jgi:hypothetical protein
LNSATKAALNSPPRSRKSACYFIDCGSVLDQMSELVADCPRCGSCKITFDLARAHYIGIRHNWKRVYEAFCVCRHCDRATIFVISQKTPGTEHSLENLPNLEVAVNRYMEIEGFVNLKDIASVPPPEHLPMDIEAAFKEGAMCKSVGCYNAAGTMFRLCVDLATRLRLPAKEVSEPNAATRRNLGLRLPWLFDNGHLPEALRELSSCVKDDGNDGAHVGSLTESDADDLLDFTVALLERMFTEPERLRIAKERRETRRGTPKKTDK